MPNNIISVTIQFDPPFWVGIFERNDNQGYAATRKVFGAEPTDPELYEFIQTNYHELNFTEPQENIQLDIKRKSFKRMQREIKKALQSEKSVKKETRAQEALRLDLEQRKKIKKTQSKSDKTKLEKERFELKQEKKKQKRRGH